MANGNETRAGSEHATHARNHVSMRQKLHSHQQYVDGILNGDRSILAQAITLIESSRCEDREMADRIIESCLPATGASIRVGITGVPGAGKSSLIEALGRYLVNECGQTVAVLAVDPSSEVSGGSILGDKTRMMSLAASNAAFIRPTPSRGARGGVAHHTREAILLCEAAGYKNILVETVGVGQSEVAVHEMVDFLLLIMLSGAGDELQGIKRGVMELVDLIAVNKADGDNLIPSERTRAEVEHALHFFPKAPSGWIPQAIVCSARTSRGIPAIWTCIMEHRAVTKANGWLDFVRNEQKRRWMQTAIEQGLNQLFNSDPAINHRLEALEQDVVEGRMTPLHAANTLLEMVSLQGSRKPMQSKTRRVPRI